MALRYAEIVIRATKSYSAHRCSLLAGGVTYYALVSLFPIALFALSIAGFVWQDPADQEVLIGKLLDRLPLDAQSGRADLARLLESVVAARGALGLIGLAGAAYSGSALFSAVRASLNIVFEVQSARPFLRGKVVDLGLVAGFGILLLLSVAATFAIAFAARFATDLFGSQAATLVRWSSALAYLLVPPALSGVVFVLLYSRVAHAGVAWHQALGGSAVAALAFELLKVGFAQYVSAFGNYDATYGALGFIIILLFFFFLSAQLMLFGAEFVRSEREYREAPSLDEMDALTAAAAKLVAKVGRRG
jgi:membrane protein